MGCHNIKIIHVAETIQGGIATYLSNLLSGQVSRYGVDNIRVIVPSSQRGQLSDASVVVESFKSGVSRVMNAVRAVHTLRRQLKMRSADVVHVHSSFAGMTCRLYLKLFHRDICVIYCPHGWSFMRRSRIDGISLLVERRLAHLCNAIICVSRNEAEVAQRAGIAKDKLHVIQNGIAQQVKAITNDDLAVDLWPEEVLRLVFIGRLDRQKGFDVLVDALERLHRRVFLHVFGGAVLHDVAASVDASEYIHYHGWADANNIAPYLASCHAVVMPSRWEGLPYTVLEAMRAGKPVIASHIGGIAEVVDDGVTGILVPPDNAQALAYAIQQVEITELKRMGQAAREKFLSHLTSDRMESELAAVYEMSCEARSAI